jgi:hypothetical protein
MKSLIRSLCILLLIAVPASAQDWSISDYLKNLPEKFKTFEGDYHPPSAQTTIIDEKNGYAGYLKMPGETYTFFEMAIFKTGNAPPVLIVSNERSDMQCSFYQTFFLRRIGREWVEVKEKVLPPLNPGMFWDDPQAPGRLAKILKDTTPFTYHFEPPRRGTQLKVTLEICDYLDVDPPEATLNELSKLKETAKTIRLDWDAKSGRFKLMKS